MAVDNDARSLALNANTAAGISAAGGALENIEMLRRARQSGRLNDPTRRAPLVQPGDWTTGEVISTPGRVRKSNGAYYVAASTGTCGATAPSHVTGQAVRDGASGVFWNFLGPIITEDIPYPITVTATGSASVPSGYTRVTLAGNDGVLYNLAGCYEEAYATVGLTLYGGNQSPSARKKSGALEFMAPGDFAIATIGGDQGFQVIVDGRFVGFDALTATGGNYYYTFENTVRRNKHVRIVLPRDQATVVAIATRSTDLIYAPAKKPVGVAIADSYFDGSSYSPFALGRTAKELLGYQLGVDFFDLSKGGTGLIKKGTGDAFYTYGERVPEALTRNPDLWFVYGSTNDIEFTSSAIQAAAEQFIEDIRTGGSKSPIVWAGPNPINNSNVVTVPQIEAAISAAITATGDRSTYLLSSNGTRPLTLGSWNNGSFSGFTDNTMNIAGDNTHPADYGIARMVDRWVAQYDKIVLS